MSCSLPPTTLVKCFGPSCKCWTPGRLHQRFAANRPRTRLPHRRHGGWSAALLRPTPVVEVESKSGQDLPRGRCQGQPHLGDQRDPVPSGAEQPDREDGGCAKAGRIEEIRDIKNFSEEAPHPYRGAPQTRLGSTCGGTQAVPVHPTANDFLDHSNFLDRGRPRTLGLKAMIERWIDHRRVVIRRRTEHLLKGPTPGPPLGGSDFGRAATSTKSFASSARAPGKTPSQG